MTIQKTFTVYPPEMIVDIPPIFVVAYLANANGEAVTQSTLGNASYVRTELFDDDNAAWARWSELTEENHALFASCQDDRGESIV